jgi:glycosyltransferase involved in cell wall biosynthesis
VPGALVVFHHGGVGGPQRSLVQASAWLGDRGDVRFVVPWEGPTAAEYRELGPVAVASYSALRYPRGVRDGLALARSLARDVRSFRRELRRRAPEVVVVVTTVLPAVLLAAWLERIPRVVYVAEIHGRDWRRRPGARLWGAAVARATARLADRVVCCSATVARRFPGNRRRLVVAYPPIGDEPVAGDRERGRDRYGIAADEPCLAVVGALSEGRGQDVALRALALIRRRLPAARLLIVGEPHPLPVDVAFAQGLERLARELGVAGAVTFAPVTDVLADVYAAADLVVNPARVAESFGRVAAEALVARRPVVASCVGAVPEVVRDGRDALLVPPGDSAALAEAAVRLLTDGELAQRLVRSGRGRVLARFGRDQDLAAWRSALEGLLVRAAPGDDGRERLEEDLDVLAQ